MTLKPGLEAILPGNAWNLFYSCRGKCKSAPSHSAILPIMHYNHTQWVTETYTFLFTTTTTMRSLTCHMSAKS